MAIEKLGINYKAQK